MPESVAGITSARVCVCVVSQLVTQEFAEMSQELELQRGLRQHAEDVAHQV